MGEGLDIAKSIFQVHGIDVAGVIVIRKRASRAKVLGYFRDLPRQSAGNSALGGPTQLTASSARHVAHFDPTRTLVTPHPSISDY